MWGLNTTLSTYSAHDMIINTALTALENIMALVNEANPAQTIRLDEVSIGAPMGITVVNGRNTELTLTGLGNDFGSRYSGTRTFAYTRLGLFSSDEFRALPSTTPEVVTVLASDDEEATKAKVFAQLPTLLPVDDVELQWYNYTAPVDGAAGSITLGAGANSYLYTGSRIFSLQVDAVDLATVAPITDLNGFEGEV